uniref:Uncharacterized protein n=1 Tax=Sphaerodactylus townsendi TaxID=933632 RepID=A0ACB8FL60_9SAUR
MEGPEAPGGGPVYDYSPIVGPLPEPGGQRARRPGGAPNGCAAWPHAGHETAAQRCNARLLQAGYEPEREQTLSSEWQALVYAKAGLHSEPFVARLWPLVDSQGYSARLVTCLHQSPPPTATQPQPRLPVLLKA